MSNNTSVKNLVRFGCVTAAGFGLSSAFAQIPAAQGGTGLTNTTAAPSAEALQAAASGPSNFLNTGSFSDWDAVAGLGLSLTSGNTDTLLLSGDLTLARTWGDNELGVEGAFIYGENDSEVSSEFALARAHYNRIIADPFYFGVVGGFLHDDLADLNYKISVMPALGVHLINNDTTKLSIEAGVGYVWEDQGGVTDEYVGFRAAQSFSYALSERSSIYETIEYLSELEDFENYSLVAEAGIVTRLTEKLSLKTLVRGTYDNTVPADIDDTDWSLITSLSYALAGADELTNLEDLEAAQAAKGTSEDWQTTALAGLSIVGGNSDTTLATLNLLSVREWGPNLLGLSVGGTYGETDDETTAETYAASANYRRTLADPFYSGIGATYLHDDIAEVDYRTTVNPALGVYLIKNDTTTLNVEVGPTYLWEDVAGVSDEYLGARIAQGLTHQLTEGIKIWEILEVIPEIEDFNNYIVNAEVGFETAISDTMSLKTYVQAVHDSTPAAGLDDTDIRIISALAITF